MTYNNLEKLTILSAIIGTIIGLLWIRSFLVSDVVRCGWNPRSAGDVEQPDALICQGVQVICRRGIIEVCYGLLMGDTIQNFHKFEYVALKDSHGTYCFAAIWEFPWFGFRFKHAVHIPLWFLLAITTIVPLYCAFQKRKNKWMDSK